MLSKAVTRFNTEQVFVQHSRRGFAVNEKQIKMR